MTEEMKLNDEQLECVVGGTITVDMEDLNEADAADIQSAEDMPLDGSLFERGRFS